MCVGAGSATWICMCVSVYDRLPGYVCVCRCRAGYLDMYVCVGV